MYLLDTNILSEARKHKAARANLGVVQFLAAQPAYTLYISVISLLEIETGILRVQSRDPKQAAVLRDWLQGDVIPTFAHHTLPIISATALLCAQLHLPNKRPAHDALIAATALQHQLTLVTRNTEDFQIEDLKLYNPFT